MKWINGLSRIKSLCEFVTIYLSDVCVVAVECTPPDVNYFQFMLKHCLNKLSFLKVFLSSSTFRV